jgi:hypothetical protein
MRVLVLLGLGPLHASYLIKAQFLRLTGLGVGGKFLGYKPDLLAHWLAEENYPVCNEALTYSTYI